MLKLHIQDDEGKTTIVPVIRDEITIGRREGNTIRLTERNVSRQHARLVRHNGTLYLEEIRSRFGTRVNGDKIRGKTPITPGDVIQIGDYLLAIHTEDQSMAESQTQDMPMPSAMTGSEQTLDDPARHAVGRDADGRTSIVSLEALNLDESASPVQEIPKAQQGRLVIVSSNLSGREFTLTKTRMVIGRTDDNDVQIDHRSISRNHAAVVFDQGSYTVRDMESANGVKVNGDFYKKADLHAGDEIELGHVKIRFVAPGEAYRPRQAKADADDLPIGEPAPSQLGKFAVVGVILLAVVVVAVWFAVRAPSEPKTPEAASKVAVTPPAGEGAAKEPTESGARADPVRKEPEAKEPEAKEPEAREPEAKEPEAKEPEAKEPEAKEPEAKEPEAKEPEAKEPEVKEPEVKEPEVKEPEVKEPEVKEPEQPTPAEAGANPKARELLTRARAKLSEGNYAEAKQLADQAARLDGGLKDAKAVAAKAMAEVEAARRLANARTHEGGEKWKQVYTETNAGIKMGNTAAAAGLKALNAKARKALADVAVGRGDAASGRQAWKEAVGAYKEALGYEPGNGTAKAGLAKAQAALKDPGKEPAGEEPPAGGSKLDQAKAIYEQAKQAKRASNLPKAAQLYRECLKMHGGMIVCREELVPILMSTGQTCSAVREMKTYVKQSPGSGKAAGFARLIEQFEPQCP